MKKYNEHGCRFWRSSLAGGMIACVSMQTMATMVHEHQSPNPIDLARIVGTAEHPMLIVPMETPGWAADIGITGVERVYKGICGPNGAHITGPDLFRAAELDLQRVLANQRGSATEVIGESPAFAVSYDATDPLFIGLYLPVIRSAAEYIDDQFDNRVEIAATMSLGTFTGDVIGSAGSTRYTIPWSVYVEGLRQQSLREDARFALGLPTNALAVNYNGSSSATSEMEIRVTAAQLRAIFGDNVVPQGQAVSITFNSNTTWNFLGCDFEPSGDQQSLIDVAVHEFVHAMGFTSGIAEGGNNDSDQIQGLDVARFRLPLLPFTDGGFTHNSRLGEGYTDELHFYSSFPTSGTTLLESGDSNQPSHLIYESDPDEKLGVMDPVIVRGTTRCPNIFSEDDILPLDDMGWRPVAGFDLNDCNGNGNPDVVDIAIGISQDVDNDSIPDECESFSVGAGDPFTAAGVTRTIYETPGLTDLSFFDPMSPSVTPVVSNIIADMDDPMSFPNSNTRVIQYEFSMFVPSRDEYAFRVAHPGNMYLLVDNFVIGQSDRAGQILRNNSSTQLSSQSFMQLEAGWHDVLVQVLSNESTPFVRMVRESRSLGGWEDIPVSHLKALNFTDCDGNGENDFIDRIHDLGFVYDYGSIGDANTDIRLDTCGSDFDTEIALWDANGVLLTQNDDGDCSLQSVINFNLPAGEYIAAISGYNVSLGPDFSVEPLDSCTSAGNWRLNLQNSEVLSGFIQSGRVIYIQFSLGDADCDGDGTPDSAELDCDNNGIPDDCEVPTQTDADGSGSIGVIGYENELITISTCGSDFDTEIAVFDSAGNLVAQNDDFCGPGFGLQSQLDLFLNAGTYYLAVSGYNALFSDGFGIDINVGGVCSEGGTLDITVGSFSESGEGFLPGRVVLAPFEVGEASACAPDLNGDGILNFFDVSVFLTAYSANDPIADFNNDGMLNFFDVSEFLSAFTVGCP